MTKDVNITVTAPVKCTEEQFREWIEFCVGYRANISIDNPLVNYSIEAEEVDVY
jgi:hypothetical protein